MSTHGQICGEGHGVSRPGEARDVAADFLCRRRLRFVSLLAIPLLSVVLGLGMKFELMFSQRTSMGSTSFIKASLLV
ncbi:hypothetical protein GUJ93_ZPchr0003g17815 [Zizania palustris]|uniref:Uncharacterized protein n=1 Tax=Zizania palustris TaxID=103762 RepID=A0A8J5SJS0_ZIZPA|nr:hypothetical protein GUJ93_ZPchr0003g17815 [Zizania palustris]